MDAPNIVITALQAEYKREKNKLGGAERRLLYAESQRVSETAQLEEHTANLALLTKAIADAGGDIPVPEEGEEPYVD